MADNKSIPTYKWAILIVIVLLLIGDVKCDFQYKLTMAKDIEAMISSFGE